MNESDLTTMLKAEQDRREGGGRTTFEDLIDEASAIRKSGVALKYGGGPGCDRGDALVYAYDKEGNVVDRQNVNMSSNMDVFMRGLVRAQFQFIRRGFTPKVYYPQGYTGESVRRTKAEIEFDDWSDTSHIWSSREVPISKGSYVIGSGPLFTSQATPVLEATLVQAPNVVQVESNSKKGEFYQVTMKNGSPVRCTCVANARFGKLCAHMKQVRQGLDK